MRMGHVVEVTCCCWHHDDAEAGADGTWDAHFSLCIHAPDAKTKPLCTRCRSNSAWKATSAGVYEEVAVHVSHEPPQDPRLLIS